MSQAPRSEKIWMDGKFLNWDDANVHVLTHTLHYGLGVFEGVRCYETAKGSAVFRLKEHTRRLFDSAKIMGMVIPFTETEINDAILETIRINGLKECYVRPIAFYGDNKRGVSVNGACVRVAIAAWSWGAYLGETALTEGIKTKVSSYIRHHENIFMTKAKVCGAYVNSILAKMEAVKDGYDEAILLDPYGHVAEGSGENIFIIRNGKLKTPPLTSILEGITRDAIITIARDLGYTVEEQYFARDELYIADEAFFTGTAAELTPIRSVDNRELTSKGVGPITKQIQYVYFDAIRANNDKYSRWLAFV